MKKRFGPTKSPQTWGMTGWIEENRQQQKQYFGRFALWASLLPSVERRGSVGQG
jgi:hypothetical protein